MPFLSGVRQVTHCLLLETEEGLVFIDTGLGTADYSHPTPRVKFLFNVNHVSRDPFHTAILQLTKLGYNPKDVRHIILTHLHVDHDGGLSDFPWAKVHVYSPEFQAAQHPSRLSFNDMVGIESAHWAHNPHWVIHDDVYREWFGLKCLPVFGNEESGILLIPLPGHTRGHCGVAISTGEHWLFHCGDAFVRASQVDPITPSSPYPPWAALFEQYMFPLPSRKLVRHLLIDNGNQVTAFCSHDPFAFAKLAGIPIDKVILSKS